MMFSQIQLNTLRKSVREYVSEYRYNHILGVERAAEYLAEILLPDKASELRVAALLHDVTKELSLSRQKELMLSVGITLTEDDLSAEPALHSFSAPLFIKSHFREYALDDILSAVSNHTLGSEDMTLFDKIIFLADFIEDGRTCVSCMQVAGFVKSNLDLANSHEKNCEVLDRAIVMAIDFTVESIIKKKQRVHPRTIRTRENINKKLI